MRLVVMGGVREAGGGCLCPETALISSAVAGMHLHEDDVVVMDTHAGVEHFGRALARGFDSVVVVVEPTFNSVQVGVESADVGRRVGDRGAVHLVVNRTRSDVDLGRVLGYVDRLGGLALRFGRRPCPTTRRCCCREPSVDTPLDGSAMADAVAALATRSRSARRPTSRPSGLVPDARRRHRHRAGRDHRSRDPAPTRPVRVGRDPLRRAVRTVLAAGHGRPLPYRPRRDALLEGPRRGAIAWGSTSGARRR